MTSNSTRLATSEPPQRPRNGPTPPVGDELDDLFNYDVGVDDVFREVDTNMNVPAKPKPRPLKDGNETGAGLGIDEEIKISKKRRPVAKLDEERLLSQNGIPKLRRVAKDRLKFKGKGHEYKDLTRLLNFYQLWLDDLYPRAKFADALAMVEKLGHTKRMQVMRREWIDEGKPRSSSTQDTGDTQTISTRKIPSPKAQDDADRTGREARAARSSDEGAAQPQQSPRTPPASNLEIDDDDDLYNATPGAVRMTVPPQKESNSSNDSLFITDDTGAQPEEDELDRLLAEDAANGDHHVYDNAGGVPGRTSHVIVEEDFQDDMEAMAGMDDMW